MINLLVVEDDEIISSLLKKGFDELGYQSEFVNNGEDAVKKIVSGQFNFVILDIMLPRLSGIQVLQEIRNQNIKTPVLVLSAKQNVEDRVRALEVGADDFLIKPFAFSELSARIKSLMRRHLYSVEDSKAMKTASESEKFLSYQDLKFDLLKQEVRRGDTKIDMHAKELSLLEYFMKNPENVLSKMMILEHVWGYDFDPQTNVVDVLVCRLRNKIDKDFDTKLIQTRRGLGYVLKSDQK